MARRILGIGRLAGVGGPARPSETDDGSDDHLHRCRDGHTWIHAGASSVRCERGDAVPGDAADCPFCAGRVHYHRCPTCEVEWLHEGACAHDQRADCPWCRPIPGGSPGWRHGKHLHSCPRCEQVWMHFSACAAPERAVLSDCLGCSEERRRFVELHPRMLASAAVVLVATVLISEGAVQVYRFLFRESSEPRLAQLAPQLRAPGRPELPDDVRAPTQRAELVPPAPEPSPPVQPAPRDMPRVATQEAEPVPPPPAPAPVQSAPRDMPRVATQEAEPVPPTPQPSLPVQPAPRDVPRVAAKEVPPAQPMSPASAPARAEPASRVATEVTANTAPSRSETVRSRGSTPPPQIAAPPPRPVPSAKSVSPIAVTPREAVESSSPVTESAREARSAAVPPSPQAAVRQTPRDEPAPAAREPSGSVSAASPETPAAIALPPRAALPGAPSAATPSGAAPTPALPSVTSPVPPPQVAPALAAPAPSAAPPPSAEPVATAPPIPPLVPQPVRIAGRAWPEPPATTQETPRRRTDSGPSVDAGRLKAAHAALVRVVPSGVSAPETSAQARPAGLGFVVDPSGYIVTSEQLVRGARSVAVELAGGQRLPVIEIRRDPLFDVAILKVDAMALPYVALGQSGTLKVGEAVVAVGSPRDRDGDTLLHVTSTGVATGGDLATDGPIPSQTVGGPLINSDGHAVGIATTSEQYGQRRGGSVGRAVPIDRAKPILRDLRSNMVQGPPR